MASVFKRNGKSNRGAPWYISWVDENGKRRTECTRTSDKSAAMRIAAKKEADAALIRSGVIDPVAQSVQAESRRPIEEHLADFRAKMQAAGRSGKHIEETCRYIHTVCTDCKFKTPSDIAAVPVSRFIQKLIDSGRSHRTCAAHTIAFKSFVKWLVAGGKLPRDPLSTLEHLNPNTDRRRRRRALTQSEWKWIESVLAEGVDRYGMPSEERLLLYRCAIETGLRANELRSLNRACLCLDEDQPCVTVRAESAKNRKDARQFISTKLAHQLREHVACKTPTSKVFSLPHRGNLAKMLRADLAHARRAWLRAASDSQERIARDASDFLCARNNAGENLDFHSLRCAAASWLVMNGANPKTAQAILRHSTVDMTLNIYTRLRPGAEARAVHDLWASVDEPQSMKATGTDHQRPSTDGREPGRETGKEEGLDKGLPRGSRMDSRSENAQRVAQRAGCATMHPSAPVCTLPADQPDNSQHPESPADEPVCTPMHHHAPLCTSGEEEIDSYETADIGSVAN
jgi:integrase